MFSEELSIVEAYRRMAFIRKFESRAWELSIEGLVAGSIHLCLGQEAIPVGTAAALRAQDRVLSTYRGHGWALARGSAPAGVLGEIAQKADGVNGGRGGSPLLSDASVGFLGENSIVGAGVPIAAGVAMAAASKGEDRVVVTSVGDGAMNQGATLEGLIFAAARNLPLIVVCENNGWSEMTPISVTTRGDDLASRATGIGIESHVVDGGDPFAVRDAVARAIETCRRGSGPVFLECKTVRLRGHYNNDIEHYRSKEDIAAAAAADPLSRLVESATASGALTAAQVTQIDVELDELIDELTQTVRDMPDPDPTTVFEHLYAPASEPAGSDMPEESKLVTYQRAINMALRKELETRSELLVYGEDVGAAGGIFGVSRGLQKDFGAARVFDTPISESAILGSAVGAAVEGMRPVVEVMWADFLFVALDQIINQASNVRYVSRSRMTAPLTVRTQQGVTPGSCAQHSQSVEAILAHIPGIKVGLAATSQDAYDMTRAAIADPDPTILIEHRSLYQRTDELNPGAPRQAAEGARLHRSGSDLTIITWGAMLHEVLAAADQLSQMGVGATVLDLRWLRPLDTEAIERAVWSGKGHVLVVHEATTSGGFGAELAAHIGERHFATLAAPVQRLGTPDVRMPSSPALQRAVLPNEAAIVERAMSLVTGYDAVERSGSAL